MECPFTIGDIVATVRVLPERNITRGRVVVPGDVPVDRSNTRGGVVVPAGVLAESSRAAGRVIAAVVGLQRLRTDGRVAVPAGVVSERGTAGSGVGATRFVKLEREIPDGRVIGARCKAEEGLIAFSSIVPGIVSVWWWSHCASRLAERHRDQCQPDEEYSAQYKRATN